MNPRDREGEKRSIKCNQTLIVRCRSLLPLGGYLRAYRMHTMGLHRACMRSRVCVLRGNAAPPLPPPCPSCLLTRQATKESIDCVTEAQARTNNAAVVATPRERGRSRSDRVLCESCGAANQPASQSESRDFIASSIARGNAIRRFSTFNSTIRVFHPAVLRSFYSI